MLQPVSTVPSSIIEKGYAISKAGLDYRSGCSRCRRSCFGIDICPIFGIASRPSYRRKHSAFESCFDFRYGKSLKPITGASKEMLDLSRLFAALEELVPTSQIGSWLETSDPAFEGSTPVQVIERGESDRIWRIAPRCAALNSALAGNAR
jgi:hypothetical protein